MTSITVINKKTTLLHRGRMNHLNSGVALGKTVERHPTAHVVLNRNAVDLASLLEDEFQSGELQSTRGDEAEMKPDQGIQCYSARPLSDATDVLLPHKSLPFSPSHASFDHMLLQGSFRLIETAAKK